MLTFIVDLPADLPRIMQPNLPETRCCEPLCEVLPGKAVMPIKSRLVGMEFPSGIMVKVGQRNPGACEHHGTQTRQHARNIVDVMQRQLRQRQMVGATGWDIVLKIRHHRRPVVEVLFTKRPLSNRNHAGRSVKQRRRAQDIGEQPGQQSSSGTEFHRPGTPLDGNFIPDELSNSFSTFPAIGVVIPGCSTRFKVLSHAQSLA